LSGGSFTGDVTFDTDTLVVDSANNRVGVGTSSPESILHINAGDSANLLIKSDGTYNIQLSNKTAANGLRPIDIEAQQLTISTNGAGGSGSTERVIINDSGNVGIGTTSTVYNAILNVAGGVNTTTGIIGTLVSDSFTFNGQTNPHYGINFNPTNSRPIGISGYAGIAFATQGTERMRIDSSGNVGIGGTPTNGGVSTAASPALQIIGTVPELNFVDTSVGADDWFIRTSDGLGFGNSTTRVTFDNSGNVGIGTTSPSTFGLFTVSGSGITNHINSTSGAGGINFYESGSGRFSLRTLNGSAGLSFYDTYNNAERLTIDSAGILQIGNSGQIKFANNNVFPPNISDHTQGTRITFYDASNVSWYAMGIESNTLWFESDEDFKWYRDGTEVMRLRGAKCLDVKNGLGTGPITSCSEFSGTAGNSYLIKPPGAMEPFWAVYSGDNYKGRGKGYFRWWYGYGDAASSPNQNKVEVDLVDLGYQYYEVIVEDMANTTYTNGAPAWEYAYWSSLQTFNTTGGSSNATSSGVGNGTARAMWGYAGGHGLYDSSVNAVCNWGALDSNAAIGAGYDGSCGVWGNTPSTTSPHTSMTGHTLRLGRPENGNSAYTESTGAFSYWFNF